MTDSLERAVKKLHDTGCALVVVNGAVELSSDNTGLKPLIDIVKTRRNSPRCVCG